MKLRLVFTTIMACVAGCDGAGITETPKPGVISSDATGYYCGMMLSEHAGPKAQIIVEGNDAPYWFSQVRDGVQFLRSPEETARVLAFYVTDMTDPAAHDPTMNPDWILARDAWFVLDSKVVGGMGAPETIPFATAESATLYASENGGRMYRLDDIPDDYILAPYTPTMNKMGNDHADADQ